MLATYAAHVAQYHLQNDLEHFILTNHTKALARVRNDISAMPLGQKRILEGILTAITTLACFSHLQKNMLSWRSHMAAIVRLIRESGLSLETLDGKLVTTVKMVDLIGSYALDIPPALGNNNEEVDCKRCPSKAISQFLNSLDLPAPLISAFLSLPGDNPQTITLYLVRSNRD